MSDKALTAIFCAGGGVSSARGGIYADYHSLRAMKGEKYEQRI